MERKNALTNSEGKKEGRKLTSTDICYTNSALIP